MNMKVSIIGASDMFARGIARWAVGAGLDVTIVGPSRARAEAFVEQLGRHRDAIEAVIPGEQPAVVAGDV